MGSLLDLGPPYQRLASNTVDCASEVSLRGIVKSGYPGIVVLEGLREDCETYIT